MRYMVVPEQEEAGITVAAGMMELLQFNNKHAHSYSKEEMLALVELLWPYGEGEKSTSSWDEFMKDVGPWMTRAPGGAED